MNIIQRVCAAYEVNSDIQWIYKMCIYYVIPYTRTLENVAVIIKIIGQNFVLRQIHFELSKIQVFKIYKGKNIIVLYKL